MKMLKEKQRSQILGGCLQDFYRYLSGSYKGFHIIIEAGSGQYRFRVSASSRDDENNARLGEFLQRQKEVEKYIIQAEARPYCAELVIRMPNLGKNIPNVINSCIDPVINYLIGGGYASGCEGCGSTMDSVSLYEVNGGYHNYCNNCAGEVHAALQQNQQQIRAQKSSLIPGLVGAFLGSLIGCALWVAIYKLGYIAGIAGAVTGICAMKGYEMLGKCLDKKGVAGSVIIMFLTIYLANKLAWSWEAYDALKLYGYTFSDAYRGLNEILRELDLTGSYYGDLIIGYVLTLVCTLKNIINAFKASGGNYSINKVN